MSADLSFEIESTYFTKNVLLVMAMANRSDQDKIIEILNLIQAYPSMDEYFARMVNKFHKGGD